MAGGRRGPIGWIAGVAWAACGGAVASAPAVAQDLVPGTLSERLVVQVDPSHSYALYLPSTYTTDRAWPVLYVMDPRGRAVRALDLFRDAAEELGWVVASSYDSRSDVPEDRNTPAFNAMLDDTQRRVRIDARRLHLAGFSGTASAAWHIAEAMGDPVAGIVVAGYGLPLDVHARMRFGEAPGDLAVYGTAGRTGFNYEDVQDMDGALDVSGLANRIVYFDGGHRWMPEGLASDALHWLELRAMRVGLREVDSAFVASRHAALLERAERLVAEGRPVEAASLLAGAASDFPDRRDVSAMQDRIVASPDYERVRRRREVEAREASEYSERLRSRFGDRAGEGPRVDPDELARELRVEELLDRAATSEVPDAAQARRLLSSAAVLLGFYGPRAALQKGSPGHALDYLLVAERIDPGNPSHCRLRAFAHTALDEADEAVDALRCWVDAVEPSPEALLEEPRLDPLHDHPRFRALVEELGGSRGPGAR